MNNIIIFGASGHAKVVIDIVEKERKYKIAGIVEKINSYECHDIFGYKILGTDEDVPTLISKHSIVGGIVAIGDNFIRKKIVDNLEKLSPDFKFITSIHPSANIGRDVIIADGTVIMAGVTINTCCSIGSHCIVNTNSSLDHDSCMGDFSSLGPNAVIGGNARIGSFTVIGIGATLIHGVQIGEHTVIGAGATVIRDIGSYNIAYGTPARIIRERKIGERYL